jgi:uncharacterized protein YjbJ (UPF0337 family)
MNDDILKGQWKQLRGKIKQQWGKLTDDELDQMEGSRDELAGALQERYGYTKETVQSEINNFLRGVTDVVQDANARDRQRTTSF